MPRHVFREYDIRGVADRDLTDEVARAIGHGLGRMLRPSDAPRPARIVVARDCRLSGERLFEALVGGLIATGAEVLDVGTGPTPMMYFSVHHLDADGGVMITGSHNPAQDNGFKIMRGKASFFGADLQELAALVEQPEPPAVPGGSLQTWPVDEAYVERLVRGLDVPDTAFRVVLDAGNGAGGPLGLRALRAAGFDPVALYCTMDGRFPNHHPDPTVPENLVALQAAVAEHGARVGIAFDGDADRIGVVDASGEIIWGDRLLALMARDVLEANPGAAIIGEVKCSQVLFDDVTARGGRAIMWKTGHSLIKTKMKEEHALLAGEMSGHFFFADRYYGFDDALYAALRVLEVLSRTGKTVSELIADLPRRESTPEIRLDCPDAHKFAVVARVKAALAQEGDLTDIDGARVRYGDGAWALVRASNTGPVIVLRFEAATAERLDELRQHVEDLVADARAAVEART